LNHNDAGIDWLGFDSGVGTRAGNPVGTLGVITMKMMISTNSTSINGTMLGSETGPRLPPQTAIPMAGLLIVCAAMRTTLDGGGDSGASLFA
jgi:hypothetical protein